MREKISLVDDPESELVWVYHNQEKHHGVQKQDFQAILDKANTGIWHHNEEQGRIFGKSLYDVLNRRGLLEEIRKKHRGSGNSLTFAIEIPNQFNNLPFEIAWNGIAYR